MSTSFARIFATMSFGSRLPNYPRTSLEGVAYYVRLNASALRWSERSEEDVEVITI
jgi:hypothetical protein